LNNNLKEHKIHLIIVLIMLNIESIKDKIVMKTKIQRIDKIKCQIIPKLFGILTKLKSTFLMAIMLLKIFFKNDIIKIAQSFILSINALMFKLKICILNTTFLC
ncbi:MAG: hypothetical protein ACQBVK_04060, partial [Candidatus Phytoplasma sp. TWB_XP]